MTNITNNELSDQIRLFIDNLSDRGTLVNIKGGSMFVQLTIKQKNRTNISFDRDF